MSFRKCSISFLLLVVSSAFGQTQFTTPGNGISIRARLFYPSTGQPCVSCPVSWATVPITTQGAAAGLHYHGTSGAPQGTYERTDTATDANGYANALWTSETDVSSTGYPIGYALSYTARVCSSVAQNVCVIVPISATYSGLAQINATTGWYKTTDSYHQSMQYAATTFFQQALSTIASKYYNANSHKTLMVVRIALTNGGVYDGQTGRAFWQNSYTGATDGEDHMYGDEADVSVYGMSTADVSYLFNAVTSTRGWDRVNNCEIWSGFNSLVHIYCGEVPGGGE